MALCCTEIQLVKIKMKHYDNVTVNSEKLEFNSYLDNSVTKNKILFRSSRVQLNPAFFEMLEFKECSIYWLNMIL